MRFLFRRNRPAPAAPVAAVAPCPLPRRIPRRPSPFDEALGMPEEEVRELAVLLIRDAIRVCRRAAEVDANARLMDEYAARYRMRRRPAVGNGGDLND